MNTRTQSRSLPETLWLSVGGMVALALVSLLLPWFTNTSSGPMGFNDPPNNPKQLDSLIYEHVGPTNSPLINVGEYPYIYTALILADPAVITVNGSFTLTWVWRQEDKSSVNFQSTEDAYFAEYQDIWGQGILLIRYESVRRVVYPYLEIKGTFRNAAGTIEVGRAYRTIIWGTHEPAHKTLWRTNKFDAANGKLLYFDQTMSIGDNNLLLATPYVGRARLEMLRVVGGTVTEINGLTIEADSPYPAVAIDSRWLSLPGGGATIYSPQDVYLGPNRNYLNIVMSAAGRVIGSIREAPE